MTEQIPVEQTIKIGDYYFNANELAEKCLIPRVNPIPQEDINFGEE
jgi:hypothetical protein